MSRQIITLTSDWNNKAYYEASVKGAFLSNCGDVNIVNISHEIAPYNISQAVFVLKNSYKFFPAETVHIVAVNSDFSKTQSYILARYDSQFFICTDNGFFSLFFDDEPEFMIEIDATNESNEAIFPELSIFPKIVAKIIQKVPIEEIGKPKTETVQMSQLNPVYDNSSITGHVVYIDSYQNAITNISKEMFEKIGKGRAFEILMNNNFYTISKISNQYSEIKNGDLLAIFNSVGMLEVAVKNGPIASLLKLELKSNIRIKFSD